MKAQLQSSFNSLLRDAEHLFSRQSYTSSLILASKAIFAFFDWKIYVLKGLVPANYEKRFEFVRYNFPNDLKDLEEVFTIYVKAYREDIGSDDAWEVLKLAKRFEDAITGSV